MDYSFLSSLGLPSWMQGYMGQPTASSGFPQVQQPSPNDQVASRFVDVPGVSANQYVAQNFPQQHVPLPMARPQQASAPALAPQAAPQQAAPQQAPQQAMGFFQRNAAMMRDPVTGSLIDPSQGTLAAQPQAPQAQAPVQVPQSQHGGMLSRLVDPSQHLVRQDSLVGRMMKLLNVNS